MYNVYNLKSHLRQYNKTSKRKGETKMRTINWNDVPDNQFELLPEGDCIGKIIKVEESVSRNGDEMWKMQIQAKGTKQLVFTNLLFIEQMLFNVKKIYEAIYGEDNLPPQISSQQLKDKIVGFVIKHQEYNGKTSAQVVLGSWFQPNASDLDDNEVNYPPRSISTSTLMSSSNPAVDEEDPF